MSPLKSITLAFIGAAAFNSCSSGSSASTSAKANEPTAFEIATDAVPALRTLEKYSFSEYGELIEGVSDDRLIFTISGVDANNDNVLQKDEVLVSSLMVLDDKAPKGLTFLSFGKEGKDFSVSNIETGKTVTAKTLKNALSYMNRVALK